MTLKHGLSVPASFIAVRELASTACASAAKLDAPDTWLFELELAVVETANNIIVHAQENGSGQIDLYVSDLSPHDGKLILEFHASGQPLAIRHLDEIQMAPKEAESGRGLALISACVDELHYERNGDVNIWRLVKHLHGFI